MKTKQLIFSAILLFGLSISTFAQTSYCLPAGHKISIRILSTLNSKKDTRMTPSAEVAGDVYDETGEFILIRKGTPVTLQVETRKANLSGSVGRITITAISTTAYNGREITFEAEPIIFRGNDNDFFRSQMNVVVPEGTAIVAPIANQYCFKIKEQ